MGKHVAVLLPIRCLIELARLLLVFLACLLRCLGDFGRAQRHFDDRHEEDTEERRVTAMHFAPVDGL